MGDDKKEILQKLPKVDKIFRHNKMKPLVLRYPKKMVMSEIRDVLKVIRHDILSGHALGDDITEECVVDKVVVHASAQLAYSLKRCVNGIGVILHTAMGRAPYPKEAQKLLMDTVANYCNIQMDMNDGKRGSRDGHVEKILCQITGAEAACVVNNNAAATMLVLNTLAEGKEVIVSRGELVEIGGAFRIPDVMDRSGAVLKDVGTTNRTHLKDYKNAISEDSACILKVHMSNYKIVGFTKEVFVDELAPLAHEHDLVLFDDLGSGALVDFSRWGLTKEPTVQDSLSAGSDVVSFSGDKLVGGPQCGIIVGKKEIIKQIKSNQLTRALRCDKMTYAVLEGTLRLFLDEEKLKKENPVIAMLTMNAEDVKKRAMKLKRAIKVACGDNVKLRLIETESQVGSGSMCERKLDTWAISVRSEKLSPEELNAALHTVTPPIFGRLSEGKYLLDCRTIIDDEHKFVVDGIKAVVS